MNPFAIVLLLLCCVATLSLDRRWVPLPLLAGCCYMTIGQVVEIGPLNFHFFRVVLAAGLFRVMIRRERIAGPLNAIDKMIIAWGAWVFFASFFHKWEPGSGPIYALGAIYNVLLIHFLIRTWCRDERELQDMVSIIAILLVPVAVMMWVEKVTVHNPFAVFGGVLETPMIREGRVRAQGPFAHPILAGTVGATSVPLMLAIWHVHRGRAIMGLFACIAIVLGSASSGPLMSLIFGIFALCAWRVRTLARFVLPAGIACYLFLSVVMSRPPYYILNYIDLTGGSTGWHRANLIENFLAHTSEWWLFGTDRTKHWMPHAPGPTPEHTDITSFYIGFAVVGGLAALALFILIIWRAFIWVGATARAANSSSGSRERGFAAWCLGSALFAHAATGVSVSYFDQSVIFLWITIAVICSLRSRLGTGRTLRSRAGRPPILAVDDARAFRAAPTP